jgi:2-dehydropantoate 2-reductase
MRVVVHGVGAIGGTVAAALALSGQEVVGIARGAQLAAIRRDGLRLRTPDGDRVARFACVAGPDEIAFRDDDMIVLAMKTQDTAAALDALRAAGVGDQAIFCAQNGVANERLALRRFANVHGVTVMMPATFLVPGEVAAPSTPRHGVLEIGRYPAGSDADDARMAAALERAGVAAFVSAAVMESKHGKLLLNLGNVLEAALGPGTDTAAFRAPLVAEAEAAFAAAGIRWRGVGGEDSRRALMRQAPVPGVEPSGGSSTQSLARGTGSIETDWLNGEVVLLGRLHGVPTPANAFVAGLGARLVRDGLRPGAVTPGEIAAGYAAAGVGAVARESG